MERFKPMWHHENGYVCRDFDSCSSSVHTLMRSVNPRYDQPQQQGGNHGDAQRRAV